MNNGILVYAFNNQKIDYIKQAKQLAIRAKHYLDLPTTLITDQQIHDECFDNVVVYDDVNTISNKTYRNRNQSHNLSFKNCARIFAFDHTPYDKTIILDSDILICNDQYAKCFEQSDDLLMYDSATDITGIRTTEEFEFVSDIGCKFYWATCVYFEKTKKVEVFFNLLQHVFENYAYYKVLYDLPTNVYRNDYAFSICAHILNDFNQGDVIGKFPGSLYHSTDRDSLIKIQDDNLLFVTEKNTAVKTKAVNVHCMNKFNLEELL